MCIKIPHRNQPFRANSAGPSVTAAARRRTQTAAGRSPTGGSRLQPPSTTFSHLPPVPPVTASPPPLCASSRQEPLRPHIARTPSAAPQPQRYSAGSKERKGKGVAREPFSLKKQESFRAAGDETAIPPSSPHLSWQPGPRSRTLSGRLNSPSAAILRFDFAARRPRRRSLKMAPGQRPRGELGARWRRRSRSRAGAPTSWRGRSASAGWCRPSGGASAGSTGSRRYREGRALGLRCPGRGRGAEAAAAAAAPGCGGPAAWTGPSCEPWSPTGSSSAVTLPFS